MDQFVWGSVMIPDSQFPPWISDYSIHAWLGSCCEPVSLWLGSNIFPGLMSRRCSHPRLLPAFLVMEGGLLPPASSSMTLLPDVLISNQGRVPLKPSLRPLKEMCPLCNVFRLGHQSWRSNAGLQWVRIKSKISGLWEDDGSGLFTAKHRQKPLAGDFVVKVMLQDFS